MQGAPALLVITNTFDRPEKALYSGLAGAGFNVEIFCRPDACGQPELEKSGIRVSHLTTGHRLDLRAVRTIRSRLISKPCNIVYAPRNNCLSAALIAARGMDVRIVAYRGTCGHITRWSPGDWLTYLHRRVDRIVCVSEAVRRSLIALRFPPAQLVTIHKGHELDWYASPKPFPEPRDIPKGAFVVGFVGNMRPVKGVIDLVRSASHLEHSGRVHYLLIGDIRDKKLLPYMKNRNKYPDIHFTGFLENASAAMSNFSVLAMPSIEREGLPKAVLEAMAQGIVPIVTEIGGMPEIVRHNENGLLVPPNNPEALARAIETLLEHPERRQAMGEMARRTVAERFNTGQMIEKSITMFRDLLKNG